MYVIRILSTQDNTTLVSWKIKPPDFTLSYTSCNIPGKKSFKRLQSGFRSAAEHTMSLSLGDTCSSTYMDIQIEQDYYSLIAFAPYLTLN